MQLQKQRVAFCQFHTIRFISLCIC